MDELERDMKIGKLPIWARQYIAKLRTDNESLRREREEVKMGESPIWWSPDYRIRYFIPSQATMTFKLLAGDIELNLRKGKILVRTSAASDRLYVVPDASNAFTIGLKEWERD